MANICEAVVTFLVNRLGDQLSQEANSSSWVGVREQVEWVETQFRWMQAFLKDAETKSDKDERVKNWIREVRNLAYFAEDTIDTFLVEIAPISVQQQGVPGTFDRINARRKLVSEIEKMKDKIRSISESRVTYGIEDIRGEEGPSSTLAGQSCCRRDRRLLSPYVEEPDFVGFETDQEKLMQQLMQVGELRRRTVVSIVGMGGQGKTTLARKLYQSDAVKGHFDVCTWIAVSQEYGVTDLLQAIMKNCTGAPTSQNMDACELRHKIAQHLEGKRYLVVLDDMWTCEAWDDLKDAFPHTSTNAGSKVLITTRNKDVALHADPISETHELRFLDDDESWELFLKKVFLRHEAKFPIDSELLKKEILGKCRGLPLAIVVAGGLLSRRKEPREWRNILKSIGWQLMEGENSISGILSLSYRDLPYYLKPCFLYLSLFPEDYEIPAKKLIRLWAAEGFLQERGVLTVEEVGEECLNELLRRCLIQVSARSCSGAVKLFRMHDLLRDFAISKAQGDGFSEAQSLAAAFERCQGMLRLVLLHNCDRFVVSNHPPTNLCSLFRPIPGNIYRILDGITEKLADGSFKLVRVLDIQSIKVQDLPSEIGKLIHLRYLSCCVDSGRLPPSIANLVNLQTLCISAFINPIRIAIEIIGMKQLRHVHSIGELYVYRSTAIAEGGPCLDNKLGSSNSSNLQTLAKVLAGEWMNDGFLERLTELKKLGINIEPLMIQSGSDETAWKSIMRLKFLESLSVSAIATNGKFKSLGQVPSLDSFGDLYKLKLEGKLENPSSVLCELPRNLTKLTLKWSHLEQDPLPILEKLENLCILNLDTDSYVGEKMACTVGGFPRLQSLYFYALDNWREWRVERGSMPCLSHLKIIECERLGEVPEGLQHVTTLKKLEVFDMSEDLEDRLRREGGVDWYKVQHIPTVQVGHTFT